MVAASAIRLKLLPPPIKGTSAFVFSRLNTLAKITSASDFSHYNRDYDAKSEMILVFLYDAHHQLIGHASTTSRTASVVVFSIRNLIETALRVGSQSMLLMHNHPSGDASPSQADITQTKSILQVLHPLQITLHDHIIYAESKTFSFKSNGLL